MKFERAVLAGIIAGAIMSFLMAAIRLRGLPINIEMMLGTMSGYPPSRPIWFLGFAVHLIMSALIALLYAAGFEHVTHRAGAAVGLTFSIIHILIGGALLAFLPALHPLVPERLPSPGAFMVNQGSLGVAEFVLLHLIYGAIVGTLYGQVPHRPARSREARGR